MEEKQECIIYGAGQYGKMAFEEVRESWNVLFFVDSDERRWGERYCGLEVKEPEVIKNNAKTLILIAVKYIDAELMEKVKKLGALNIKKYYPGIGTNCVPMEEFKREKPGLLVEATLYAKFDKPTGAERLMYNIMEGFDGLKADILPVVALDDAVLTCKSCEEQCKIYHDPSRNANLSKTKLVKGDKILFLSGTVYGSFHSIVDRISNNVESYVLIWDVYYTHQKLNMMESYRKGQVEGLCKALALSKGIICYSKAVLDEVVDYYEKLQIVRKVPLNMYLFPLGADIKKHKGNDEVRNAIKKFMSKGKVFLMVGAIRTHKGHMTVLEAFKKNDIDIDIKLIIIGQLGRNRADLYLVDEIQKLVKEKDNVLWIKDANDDEVVYCYEHASALIQASKYEGYGLPLIEAAQYGLPLICSDIPIFREVTCGHADLFKVGDSNSLAETLRKWLSTDNHPDSRMIPIHTWRESTEALLDIVAGRTEPYVVLK